MQTTTEQFLASRFSQESNTALEITNILSEAAELGLSIPEVKKALFAKCDNPETQQAWGNWESATNREEIRLRLQAILSAHSFDSSLCPFILFFFRASDPVVYQTAARIVGKWLHSEPKFQNYIKKYLELKKVEPSNPVLLNGQRARRRLLIAFTEHYATQGPELRLNDNQVKLAYPVESADLENISSSTLDFSIIMVALGILQKYGDSSSKTLAEKALTLINEKSKIVSARDRTLIRSWGILLSSYDAGSAEKKQFLAEYLNQSFILYQEAQSFTKKLNALFRVDEILRSGVFTFKNILADAASFLPDSISGEFRHFCYIRLAQWTHREIVAEAFSLPELNIDSQIQSTAIQELLRAVSEKGKLDQTEAFPALMRNLKSNADWRLEPLGERVLQAFILLDFSTHCLSVRFDELNQIISTFSGDANQNESPEISDKIHLALSAILRRLIDAEHTAKAMIPDSKLIHKIYDESLLLQLLPTASDSDLLPVLADAFENRIRLLLAVSAVFNLDHYLYLVSVREPNRNFYRHLKELSKERTYTNYRGEHIHFRKKVDYLYQSPAEKSRESLSDPLTENRFWSSVQQIRNRLAAISSEENLFKALELFEHELDGTGTETLVPGSTLHDLLNIAQPAGQLFIQSGFPAQTRILNSDLNRALADIKEQLKNNRQKLIPSHFGRVDEAGETTHRLKADISRSIKLLAPVSGGAEADLLLKIDNHFSELLNHWTDQIASLTKFRHQLKSEYPYEGEKFWSSLFEKALHDSSPSIRPALLEIIASGILKTDDSGYRKSWLVRYQFLSWACEPSTLGKLADVGKKQWLQMLAPYWVEMVSTAMDLKQEARVVQMVKASELAPLRRSDAAQTLLAEVKTWCYNRYDILHASICNREMSPERNFLSVRWKTFREYFAHFVNVWVALIVGVILMFDFGDPWTELAEMGNVGGVVVTFFFGVAGTYFYVFYDLRKQVTFVKSDPFQWASLFGRVGFFLAITLAFTVAIIMIFWLMFSETGQVLHGFEGLLHIMAWTGFALFMGVFFGLIGKQ